MGISTKIVNTPKSKLSKRDKVQLLRKKHTSLFAKENVKSPKFSPRMCYMLDGELVISCYDRELYGENDLYTEFCNRDYEQEEKGGYPKGTLWKWIYNPEYRTEYKKSDVNAGINDVRYIIPIEELINVTELHSSNSTKEEKEVDTLLDAPTAGEEVPYSSMTLRDYLAIQLKIPVSHKSWLNEIISKNK